MIQVLGVKRVLTLTILLLVNMALAGGLYGVLIPQTDKTERDLRVARAAVQARRSEIQTLQTEYQQIQEQKNLFGDLDKAKFFTTQNRVEARRMIEAIQSESRVLSARYSIGAAEIVEDPAAAVSDHVIMRSPVSVKVDALDDTDIYNFLYWVENAFPGQAAVTSLTVERMIDVDEVSLRQIGNSIPTVLVTADVVFDWNTMVPRSQVPQQLGVPQMPR